MAPSGTYPQEHTKEERPDTLWKKGHRPGAVHLEANKVFSRATLSRFVNANQEVAIYCAGPG